MSELVLLPRRYERISIENRRFCRNGVSLAENVRYGSSLSNHSSCRKTRWMCILYGIRISAEVSFVLAYHNSRVWQTDRQTDGNLVLIPPCIVCSVVKTALQASWNNCQDQLGLLRRSFPNFSKRLTACIKAKGGHSEHLITVIKAYFLVLIILR